MMDQVQSRDREETPPKSPGLGDRGGGPRRGGTTPLSHVLAVHQWQSPEPTLGTGRGAQLASPGQRALPPPCDSGCGRLGGSPAMVSLGAARARPPRPSRPWLCPRAAACWAVAGSSGGAERPGRGLRGSGAGQGWAGPGEGNPGGRGTPACPWRPRRSCFCRRLSGSLLGPPS